MTDYTAALSDQLRLTIYHLPLYCRALSCFSFYRRTFKLRSTEDSIENWESIYISLHTDSLSSHFLFRYFFLSFLIQARARFLVHFSCKSNVQLSTSVFVDENRDDNLFAHIYYKQILEIDNDITIQ